MTICDDFRQTVLKPLVLHACIILHLFAVCLSNIDLPLLSGFVADIGFICWIRRSRFVENESWKIN